MALRASLLWRRTSSQRRVAVLPPQLPPPPQLLSVLKLLLRMLLLLLLRPACVNLTLYIIFAWAACAQALPIQCVEAVFLAIHFTHGLLDVDRIPVSFKSSVGGHMFRHIVLAVRHKVCVHTVAW